MNTSRRYSFRLFRRRGSLAVFVRVAIPLSCLMLFLVRAQASGQANSTPDVVPAKMELVAGPSLVRDTPEVREKIEDLKEIRGTKAILDALLR